MAHSPTASRRKHALACVSGDCVSEHIRCKGAIRYAGHTTHSDFSLDNGTTDVSDELAADQPSDPALLKYPTWSP